MFKNTDSDYNNFFILNFLSLELLNFSALKSDNVWYFWVVEIFVD